MDDQAESAEKKAEAPFRKDLSFSDQQPYYLICVHCSQRHCADESIDFQESGIYCYNDGAQ